MNYIRKWGPLEWFGAVLTVLGLFFLVAAISECVIRVTSGPTLDVAGHLWAFSIAALPVYFGFRLIREKTKKRVLSAAAVGAFFLFLFFIVLLYWITPSVFSEVVETSSGVLAWISFSTVILVREYFLRWVLRKSDMDFQAWESVTDLVRFLFGIFAMMCSRDVIVPFTEHLALMRGTEMEFSSFWSLLSLIVPILLGVVVYRLIGRFVEQSRNSSEENAETPSGETR